jgi:acyl-CoA thioester hydrolase
VQLKYHRPARLDDALRIETRLLEAGRASLLLQQRSWATHPPTAGTDASGATQGANGHGTSPAPVPSADSMLLCEGRIRIGWVDAARMRPRRIPDPVMAALAPEGRRSPQATPYQPDPTSS